MNRTTKTPTLAEHPAYAAAAKRLADMQAERQELDRQISDAQERYQSRCRNREQIARAVAAGTDEAAIDPKILERDLTQLRTRRNRLADAIELFKRETVSPLRIEASKTVCDAHRNEHKARVKKAAKLLRELAETLDEQRQMFEQLAADDVHVIELRTMVLPGLSLTEQSSLARHFLLEAMEHGFISAADAGVKSLVDPAPPPHKLTCKLPEPKRGKSLLSMIYGD